MNKKWMTGITVMAAVLCGAGSVHAEISDPAQYTGTWYMNYMMEGQEGARINVPGMLASSYTVTLEEDGTGSSSITPLEEDGGEAESMALTWEYADGKITVTMEDGSSMIIDETDGEVLGDIGDDTWFVLDRELIEGETDWDALLAEAEEEEIAAQVQTAKENPYVYHPDAPNTEAVIAAYMSKYSFGYEYAVAIDGENGTFTADRPGDEYMEAEHIEGTYEVTEDGFVNIAWTDEAYGFDNTYNGAEYIQKWDALTMQEDLSDLTEAVAAMANEGNYGHTFTAESAAITESSDTEGTVTLTDGDYEITYDYVLYHGADPMIRLSYYDEELDYTPEWNNHSMR